ncbi:MAG: radical SAM protein [Desulfobacterium sp.]
MAIRRRKGAPPRPPIEKGQVFRGTGGGIKIALVYPNTYRAGMSSLGFQKVFQLFNTLDGMACERVFLPEKPSTPARSCETGRELGRFDIIAFSISFENDYAHLVTLLNTAGIPPRQSQRNANHPLVMAGGVACFLNPEPLAPFMDCFLLGEIENTLHLFLKNIQDFPLKQHLTHELALKIPGLYIPSLYTPVYNDANFFAGHETHHPKTPDTIQIQHIAHLEDHQTVTGIISSDTAFKNTCLIETGRGCHHGCRFCSAGFIYRPPRVYPKEVITRAMDQASKLTHRVGLVSAAVSDHPQINDICTWGIEKSLNISFSSLRLDALTPELVDTLAESGVKTSTIAPEAGTQRMRNIINKKVTRLDILSAVKTLVHGGIINLKLYFMIGLPFETDEDVEGIISLTLEIRDIFLEESKKNKKIGTITLSVNPFVPKPATPFQWLPMAPAAVLKKRTNHLKNSLKKIPNMKINCESQRMARINGMLARGDQRVATLIETAAQEGWSKAVSKKDLATYLYREIDTEAPLPWDILDSGIKKNFLVRELQRAKREKTTPDCPMIDCEKCGICR